jgi:hypothetical protein
MQPARQTVGRVNKARHLHVTVSQGLGGPCALCFAHTCAQSYTATGSSAYSDLYIQDPRRGGGAGACFSDLGAIQIQSRLPSGLV